MKQQGAPAILVVFGGLPGTGKTTISRTLAARMGAVYVRIDIIEQALRSENGVAGSVGPAGYAIGIALAASNLANLRTVIVDCVNPVAESRQGWRRTAVGAASKLIEIEIVCSDPVEHRRRIEPACPISTAWICPTGRMCWIANTISGSVRIW